MFIKQAIVDAYTKAYGTKKVDQSEFSQKNPKGFKAIKAVFGNYASFLEVVTAPKAVVVPSKPVVTTK